VTGTPTQEENIRNKGGEYTGMPVEVDGRIVTAKGPMAAREFGEQLAYLLEE
jgi:putative intracellular protease/amidase